MGRLKTCKLLKNCDAQSAAVSEKAACGRSSTSQGRQKNESSALEKASNRTAIPKAPKLDHRW